MKRMLLIATLIGVVFNISAKQINPDKALQVASNFISGQSAVGFRSSSDMQLIYTATTDSDSTSVLRSSGTPLFYIFSVAGNNGFVIVSADDNIRPVLGYADQGSFRVDDMPANVSKWLDIYKREITYALDKGYEASAETIRSWEQLSAGSSKAASNEVLLSTALWDQTEPYNDLCPLDPKLQKRTVSGCVATAMAILMEYHQWPEKGAGSIAYKTKTESLSVSADFNVSYDWNSMLNAYTKRDGFPQWSDKQGKAVSTLIFHTGASVYMDYGTQSSGSNEWNAVSALLNNFDYDKGMYLAWRDLYSLNEWHTLLQSELDEGRPLLYGGVTSDEEGHQFIIDGYNSADYYHLNWGWSGYANGYYLITSLEPTWQGTGGSKDGEGFSFGQDVVIGLQKAKRGSKANHEFFFYEIEDEFDVLGLSTNVDIIEKDKPFVLKFSYVYDYGERDFNGSWGFFIVDKNENRKTVLEIFDYNLEAGYVLYNDQGDIYTITTDIEEGDKLRLFYNSDGVNWKPVRGTANAVTELPLGVKVSVGNLFVANNKKVKVSPTLATSSVQIQSPDNAQIQKVQVFNFTGSLVKEQRFSSGETYIHLPVNNLLPGAYILSIETTNGVEKHKIIKQ